MSHATMQEATTAASCCFIHEKPNGLAAMKIFSGILIISAIFSVFSLSTRAGLPPPVGGEVVMLSAEKLESLDPTMRLNPAERAASALVCETLYKLHNGRAENNLVLRSQIENNAKSLHVWLKPGILFHDGSPLQAIEVKAALERLAAPSTGSPYGRLLDGIIGAGGVAADGRFELSGFRIISAYEFVIDLESADENFILRLTHPATAICKDAGENGSGPFRVLNRRSAEVRLEANLEHRDGRPFLDKLTLRYSEGVSAERRILKRSGSDGSMSGRVRSGEEGRIFSSAVSGAVALFPNPGRGNQDLKRFSELLRYAFDCREALRLFEPRAHTPFEDDKEKKPLEDASCVGFSLSPSLARGTAAALTKRDIKVILRSDDPALVLPAQRMKLELEACGVLMNVSALSLEEYRAALASGDYDYEFAWDLNHPASYSKPPIVLYRIVPEAYICNPFMGGLSFDELGLPRWADVWEAVQ